MNIDLDNSIRELLMLKKPQFIFFSLLLFSACFSVHAQVTSWSLDAVMREAASRHPDVRMRLNERQAANDRLDAAEWARFPSFSTQWQPSGSTTPSVARLEQPLWAGGRIDAQISLSQAGLKAADAATQATQLDLLQRSATSYFEWLRLKERLETSRQNETEHARLLSIIQRRVAAEVNPRADELQATSRWQQAKTDLIQTERQIDNARLALEELVGKPVQDILPASKLPPLSRLSESEVIASAIAFSPERARLLSQIDLAESQIQLAQAQFLPTLVAGYQSRIGNIGSAEQRTQTYISLQAQTGGGLSSLSNVRAAAANKSAAQEAVESHDRKLNQTVRSTWVEILALQSQVEPVRASLFSAKQIVDSYLRQFQVGRKNWLDVLNAQRESTQAGYALADLEFPLMLSQVRLLLLAGYWNASSINFETHP